MTEEQSNQPLSPTCDGLLIYCSDFRFWRIAFNYMIEDLQIGKFDILCFPGSAANLCRDLTISSIFIDKIRFLLNRHHFHTIVIANHTDCGGYGDRSNFTNLATEKQTHLMELMSAKSKLISEFPNLKIITMFISQEEDSIWVEQVM